MIGFKAVARDGDGTKSGIQQLVKPLLRQCEAIGDHAPRIAALMQGTTDSGEVLAHQRFTAGDNDQHLMRIDMRRDLRVYHMQKIFGRHVRRLHRCHAVTAAMQTMHIATQRGLPEELLERVDLLEVRSPQTLQPQRDFQTQIHEFVVLLFAVPLHIPVPPNNPNNREQGHSMPQR